MERDKLEAEKKELEGRANFLLFTQEQLRSQASAFTSSQNLLRHFFYFIGMFCHVFFHCTDR